MEIKAAILGAATSAFVLGLTFGLTALLRSSLSAETGRKPHRDTNPLEMVAKAGGQANQGLSLFERNCAHCHGDDARGNEGPNLYNLAMSDARIAKRIKEGIKGEMPKFGRKLNDGDVAALIVFLRRLKD